MMLSCYAVVYFTELNNMNLVKVGLFLALVGYSYSISAEQFKVFLFTKTAGWHHKSISAGVDAIEYLGRMHDFEVEWQENTDFFTDQHLAQFDLIIFLNTTADILDDKQQEVFKRFIRSGKGFVGIHSAADTEYEWPWYGQLVGHYFLIHPEIQTARINVLKPDFPGMEFFHNNQLWTDEWYEFKPANIDSLNYLMAVDENTYAPAADWGHVKGDGMGEFHPIAWFHEFDGGRSFYTSLGHLPTTYSNPQFLNHLYGGIYWAATGNR